MDVDVVAHIAGLPVEELVGWAVAGGFGALGVRPWLAYAMRRRGHKGRAAASSSAEGVGPTR